MPEPDTITVPIGKGDIRFVYLDENYKPTINDIGKMAMYVENNELTKDVLVMAEIQNDNIDNDIVVRVINKQNHSLVSFFYYRGQYFPHKAVITTNDENIIGRFSLYDPLSETYSVEFTYENGESDNLNDFILNKNVFSLHKKNDALTDTQNIRISRILTTLALWNSLAFQIDDNFQVGGRAIKWLKTLAVVFAVVAVVAFVVAVIVAPPAAVAIVGATLTVSITTTATAIAAGIAMVAGVAAVITNILAEALDKTDTPVQKQPPPNEDRRPKIEITLDAVKIKNNGMPPYLLKYNSVKEEGESLSFILKITDKGEYTAKDIIDIDKLINWFDPDIQKYISKDYNNAEYFDLNKDDNIANALLDGFHIVISKNNITGYNRNGRVQLVLKFRKDIIINDNSDGIDFWDDFNNPVKEKKDIFVINLTVEKA
jgi:hypothetical protein